MMMCYSTPSRLLRSPFASLNWVDNLVDDLFEPRMEIWPASRLHHRLFNQHVRDMQKQMDSVWSWADNRLQALNAENAEQKLKLIEDGEKEFKLQLACNSFKPEEIQCKTDGSYLTVEGNHEEKDDAGKVVKRTHFVRRVLLPETAEVDKVDCRLKPDGVLAISIPKKPLALEENKEKVIPIQSA